MAPPSPQAPTLQAPTLRFDPEALGQPQPWVVSHRGLQYAGEVIVAEAVNLAWGHPLEDELSFRIVFFTVPRRIPPGQIQDSRTAMAVPTRATDPARLALGRELRAVHEAKERYVTSKAPEAPKLLQTMEEREAHLRAETARRYAISYSPGRIYTRSGARIRSKDIFVEERPESWVERLASALLSLAYPTLPLDPGGFPHTLTGETVSVLYRGLFHADRDAQGVTQAFGPGLRLTRSEVPGMFDAAACDAVLIIRRELESRGGEASAQEILRLLTRAHGLPRPLALLYLMAFVRQARAEVELGAGHRVQDRQRRPFPGDRITWDLISEVSFSDSMVERLGTIRLQASPTWDTVLPYATLLVRELEPAPDPAAISFQERRLLDALGGMAPEIEKIEEDLESLELSLGRSPSGLQALRSLRLLCAASSYREFYSVARERFKGPSDLNEALAAYKRLAQLATLAPAIVQMKRYLEAMTFGPPHEGLSLDRDSIAAMIDLDSLAVNPSLWSSVEDNFRRLRVRYAAAYASHHAGYRQQALELAHRIDRVGVQGAALARFNEMPELGEPVGMEVPRLFKELRASFKACPVGEDDLSLQVVPHCQTCLLPLREDPPHRNVELAFGSLDRAIREYNRRLSSVSVRQILSHPTREQLDKFINLVQVADPSALANVLDDEVVEFLRRFLRDQPGVERPAL